MIYELPSILNPITPNWPQGIGSIPVMLSDGNVTNLPILEANMLVTGTTGYGKTVFTKAVAHGRFDANPALKGLFYQIKPDDFTSEFKKDGDKIIRFVKHSR